jgi:hypothetical protein
MSIRISRIVLTALLAVIANLGKAHAKDYHYACKRGDDIYALRVHVQKGGQGYVKMQQRSPTTAPITFRILRNAQIDDRGKGGWKLSDGATFCYYTQGVGSLEWRGKNYECQQADVE